MLCAKPFLEVPKIPRRCAVTVFCLDEKPRHTIARNEKIHFPLGFVTDIAQGEFTKAKVSPPFNGL